MARRVELNITKEQAADFIDWLGNDDYWGHTITRFQLDHGREEVEFIINGHALSNYSNQHHQVLIDRCYCYASMDVLDGGYQVGNKHYTCIEYCLMQLGF